ncbi:NAD(P)H-binding protein [Oceanobacillus sp. CFH 90083]|uniref:NAD(P)H-binding protein n=1 Tax=Oceanobacillus sp. CFH 90083 TaxID=2592336 RepID=UPI001D15BA01|nr:NAD(P)H-binding protein [Oceanobacillus sp. CFH 90083]
MKVLILGAAGQIADLLRDNLLKETDNSLVLYARNAHQRLTLKVETREEIVEGDFLNEKALKEVLTGVDAVYLNDMGNTEAVKTVIKAMKASQVKRFIGASILGIYNEVCGAFGEWNQAMIGSSPRMQAQKDSAEAVENSDLDYTLLRLTWLYNEEGNEKYSLTQKGEEFIGAQVTREAVARLIVDILTDTSDQFIDKSVGVSEPGTDWEKPSFY